MVFVRLYIMDALVFLPLWKLQKTLEHASWREEMSCLCVFSFAGCFVLPPMDLPVLEKDKSVAHRP